jgi:hypothetical protein
VFGGLGAILSLWLFRVHRVVIDAGAIRVYRGLRPFPLIYPRPPCDAIVTLERSVHLGQAGPARLVNPFASRCRTRRPAGPPPRCGPR